MTIRVRTLLIGLALAIALAAGGAWLFVYLGVYNIAATVQHTAPVYKLLDYAMYRSLKARADALAPPDLGELRRVAAGAAMYRAHCVQCHGAPGVAPDPLAYGMTPEPVNLMPAARHWEAGEIFWIVKHGIKMSGMPAWKYRMEDESIWDLVAFVKAMAAMSPLEYARLVRELPPPPPRGQPAQEAAAPIPVITGRLGNPVVGREKAQLFLCATCHQIPGLVGATPWVGPPLGGIGKRSFIAGVIVNRPENMIRFLLNPQAVDPLSAMPALALTPEDARDIAAYLYTLDASP